jgi:hypothetical protein
MSVPWMGRSFRTQAGSESEQSLWNANSPPAQRSATAQAAFQNMWST